MKTELKPAKMEDLSCVRDCANRAYAIYVERMGQKPAPMVADFEMQISESILDIVMNDNEPVGFAVSFIRDDHLFVENVAILPDHQGKGIGAALFTALESKARVAQCRAIDLYTNEKMTENIVFYGRAGFAETGRLTEAGFNRVYFRKSLS